MTRCRTLLSKYKEDASYPNQISIDNGVIFATPFTATGMHKGGSKSYDLIATTTGAGGGIEEKAMMDARAVELQHLRRKRDVWVIFKCSYRHEVSRVVIMKFKTHVT